MTSRARIIAYVQGKPVDRVPFVIQWGPWGQTHQRWKEVTGKRD